MSIADDPRARLQRARRQRDERDYRWVFWAAFPFFFAVTLVSRLIPGRKAPLGVGRQRPSIFREAWVAANSSIPFAFMI